MNHKKELFKRNEKKFFLFNMFCKSLLKFKEVTITSRRAKFLKKIFTNKNKETNQKSFFIKSILKNCNLKTIEKTKHKKIIIFKREKRKGDFSSLVTVQLFCRSCSSIGRATDF